MERRSALAAVCAIALCGAVPAAHASGWHVEYVPIHQAFVHNEPGACSYRATVDGTLRVTIPPHRAVGDERYAPDLVVNATWSCPGSQRDVTSANVQGDNMSATELERSIRQHARIVTGHGDTLCYFEPQFTFDGRQFASARLARWCRPETHGIGGGPLLSR